MTRHRADGPPWEYPPATPGRHRRPLCPGQVRDRDRELLYVNRRTLVDRIREMFR